jgi:hypothetical protein
MDGKGSISWYDLPPIATRLFKLPPRNAKQKANLEKFGNLVAA